MFWRLNKGTFYDKCVFTTTNFLFLSLTLMNEGERHIVAKQNIKE